MSLLEQQNFLARIYTDENLRREFLSAPERIGSQHDLNETEIAELAAVFPEELNSFADSLVYKRLREVEKLLPLSREVFGEDFEKYFREYANQFTPESIKKHLEDAIGFSKLLEKKETAWKKDVVKFERYRLKFYGCEERLIFIIFDYDIREFFSEAAKTQKDYKKRKTFAIWLKIGNKSRQFVW